MSGIALRPASAADMGAVLELLREASLLRSLVVVPELRHGGAGAQLVAAAEGEARAAGVRSSSEFRSLCPASAVCMTRFLDGKMPGASHG